ncbi:phosphoenolpyruvate synthase/pyruvate phosphate dikinase [Bradyrhizobium sp. GM22.5]
MPRTRTLVAGIRTPQDITEKARVASGSDKPSMERAMAEAYNELVRIYGILEKHYREGGGDHPRRAAALDQLLRPTIDPKADRKILAMGLPASPGAASGEIVFNSEDAEAAKKAGHKVILMRVERRTSTAYMRRRAFSPPAAP